jgi:DNA-binding NtrC family response regulator
VSDAPAAAAEVSPRVVVVDDDPTVTDLLEYGLEPRGWAVVGFTEPDDALKYMAANAIDVMITDLQLAGASGLALCAQVVEQWPSVPVIVVTGHGSMEAAVAAIRAGAYDFVTKPIDLQAMALTLRRALDHRELREEVNRLRSQVGSQGGVEEMLGDSPKMERAYDLIRRVADSQATVLVTGESGTGKELVARAIHRMSARREGPFVPVNLAAVPSTLLESELFGHVQGAFTDARRAREGLIVKASGGTLFLDEIGEMPLDVQPKLLRVLQERKVRPVGGDAEIPVDARVVAATNHNLERMVDEGRFRDDLFYRINVVQVELPALRERGNDVLLLAQKFVSRFAEKLEKPVRGLSSPAAQRLLDYDWPGNVRELENCIERAVTLTRFDQITVDDLPRRVRDHTSSRLIMPSESNPDQMLTLQELERRYIQAVLDAVDGNKSRAAKVLGLDRRTLYRKLERGDA